MPSRFSTLISILVLMIIAVPAVRSVRAGDTGVGPFVRHERVIAGSGDAGPYPLDARFIGGTLSVEGAAADTLGVASWNGVSGTVTFTAPVAAGDSVRVSYGAPPSWMAGQYQREPDDRRPGQVEDLTAYRGMRDRTPKPFPGLTFGGSKTFEVNVGDARQAALNQTLRLTVSGRLTDDITLNAVISDRNIPIAPDGTTRELSDLDRVLIELRGKRFSLDMGDTELSEDHGRWLGYERRLSGAHGVVQAGPVKVFGSSAVSEGRHMSVTLPPVEGIQGPYRLPAEDGRMDVAVVPGTEQIWINGDLLTRGIDGDYIVDYETGEITFTERRIIGADMRIVADYEYTSESYRRTFYAGGAGGTVWGDRLKFRVTAAREADDPDRPVLAGLDADRRKALAGAGDADAVVSGLRQAAEDSTGSYDLTGDRLVYNPTGDGAYNVTFSWMGEDAGSYRYRGGGIYDYVPEGERGPGSGASYEPVALLDSPVSHTVAGGTFEFTPTEWLSIEGEAAGSALDMNTLSAFDDGDNDGNAWRAGIVLSPTIDPGVPVTLTLAGNHRYRDTRFRALDRDRTAEENRQWGLPLIMVSGEERITEYEAGAALAAGRFEGTGFGADGGSAELGGGATSVRGAVRGRWKLGEIADFNARLNHSEREDVSGLADEETDRLTAGAGFTLSEWNAGIRYEDEQVVGRNGFNHGSAYRDLRTELRGPVVGGVTGAAEWFHRAERARRGAWEDSARVRGGGLELAVDGFTARYSRRERTGDGLSIASDQALLEGGWRPQGGRVSLDVSYRAGRTRETTKRRNYLYVGDDRGSYRWEDYDDDGVHDTDEFVPDDHGGFLLYEEPLDVSRPVNTVEAYGRVGMQVPGAWVERLLPRAGPLPDIDVDTSLEVTEKSAAPASDVFLLNLGKFRKHGTTSAGDVRVQQDITVPLAGNGSLRLRVFRFASYDAEYVTGAERRGEDEESLRLRVPVSERWDSEVTVSHERNRRAMDDAPAGDYGVRAVSGDVSMSYHPDAAVTLGLALGGGSDRDGVSGARARYVAAGPTVTWHFSGAGRLTAAYGLTSASFTGISGRIPYTMARGKKEGDNHDVNLTLDYRISRRMNIVASYTGRRFADRDYEQYATTRLRAMF